MPSRRILYHILGGIVKGENNRIPIIMADDAYTRGMDEIAKALQKLQRASGNVPRALTRCGRIIQREAKANAPRSPTMKILSATLKRKKRTARRTFPGGLEKSINYELLDGGKTLSVFVASNSFAGKYAKRIHDEKGITWRNRGAGTIAKGTRADEKFIYRAIKDNAANLTKIITDEIKKAVK